MAEADLDKLMGHLTGASFQDTFFTWCSEHCAEFSGYEPGCEHRHAWRSLHSDFSELFDKLMDEFLQEVGWEKGYVMELCSGAEGGGAEFVTTLVESMERVRWSCFPGLSRVPQLANPPAPNRILMSKRFSPTAHNKMASLTPAQELEAAQVLQAAARHQLYVQDFGPVSVVAEGIDSDYVAQHINPLLEEGLEVLPDVDPVPPGVRSTAADVWTTGSSAASRLNGV